MRRLDLLLLTLEALRQRARVAARPPSRAGGSGGGLRGLMSLLLRVQRRRLVLLLKAS